MTRRTRRFPRLAVAMTVVGLAVPAGAVGYVGPASPQDVSDQGEQSQPQGYVEHRSADALDASIRAQQAQELEQSMPQSYVEHRSADALDASIRAQQAQELEREQSQTGYVDHRSPDATSSFVRSPAPKVAEPTIAASSGGFDWGDAGIGAGAALGLLLIGLSVMFTVVHHRNRTAAV
jgi:hypothetical protein